MRSPIFGVLTVLTMTMSLFRIAAANCWVERKLIKYNKNANCPDYNKVIDTELNRRCFLISFLLQLLDSTSMSLLETNVECHFVDS